MKASKLSGEGKIKQRGRYREFPFAYDVKQTWGRGILGDEWIKDSNILDLTGY
jgi:hypothetical protein